MRRRGDQLDARLRVPESRDLGAYLVSRKLSALPGLRSLRDLDLELIGEGQVFGRDPKTCGSHLLDPRVPLRAEAVRILASLAGVRSGAEPVESGRHRLVRFGRKRAV